jgi:hypothetical protein
MPGAAASHHANYIAAAPRGMKFQFFNGLRLDGHG